MPVLALIFSMFFHQDALPPSDSTASTIIFYREYRFQGGAWRHEILLRDSAIGRLKNNSFFVYTCKPGDYDFQVRWAERSTIHIKAEAGKTYYVRFGFRQKFSLSLSNSVEPDLIIAESAHALLALEKIKSTSKKKRNPDKV